MPEGDVRPHQKERVHHSQGEHLPASHAHLINSFTLFINVKFLFLLLMVIVLVVVVWRLVVYPGQSIHLY